MATSESVVIPVVGWVSCPRCSLRARSGQGFCEQCGFRLLAEGTPGTGAAPPDLAAALRSHRCEGCGASVLVPEGERTVSCAFCGTPYVRTGEVAPERFAPEFVLPFSVSRREAEDAYRAWLGRGGFFCPSDLRTAGTIEALRGVYIPFWSFSMRSESAWDARIGEYWYETVTETYTVREGGKTVTKTRTKRIRHTEWYPLSGRYHQFHSGYLVPASKGLPRDLAARIQPFPVSEVTRFAPHFLSGWLCEEYTLGREEAAKLSEAEFRERERRDIAAFLPGDTHSDLRVSTDFHDVAEDLILLPVWIFSYRYRERTFRFAVNGATGQCHGDRPVSGARIALLVVLVLVALGLIALAAYLLGRPSVPLTPEKPF